MTAEKCIKACLCIVWAIILFTITPPQIYYVSMQCFIKPHFKILSCIHCLPPHQLLKLCACFKVFFFLKHLCMCDISSDFAASSNHPCINSCKIFSPPPQNEVWILLKHLVVRSEQKIYLASHRKGSNPCGAFWEFILSSVQNGIQKSCLVCPIPHLIYICLHNYCSNKKIMIKWNTVAGYYWQLEVRE